MFQVSGVLIAALGHKVLTFSLCFRKLISLFLHALESYFDCVNSLR
jgi:hypothetical protein